MPLFSHAMKTKNLVNYIEKLPTTRCITIDKLLNTTSRCYLVPLARADLLRNAWLGKVAKRCTTSWHLKSIYSIVILAKHLHSMILKIDKESWYLSVQKYIFLNKLKFVARRSLTFRYDTRYDRLYTNIFIFLLRAVDIQCAKTVFPLNIDSCGCCLDCIRFYTQQKLYAFGSHWD